MQGGSARGVSYGLAALTGLLAAVSFLPHPFWHAFAWVAYAPLLVALEGARPWKAAVLTGLATTVLIGISLWGFVSVHWSLYLLALFFFSLQRSLFGLVYSFLSPFVPRLLLAPSLWVLSDYLLAWGPLGFPGLSPGYTQVDFLPLLQVASLTGVSGVTFLLLMGNAFGAELWGKWAAKKARMKGKAQTQGSWVRSFPKPCFPLLLMAAFIYGIFSLPFSQRQSHAQQAVDVVLLQGQSPLYEAKSASFARYLALTRKLLQDASPPSLVIWPESAGAPVHRGQLSPVAPLAILQGLAQRCQTAFLFGSAYLENGKGRDGGRKVRRFNAALAINQEGRLLGYYAKRHLVPFGEYLPGEGLWRRLNLDVLAWVRRTVNEDYNPYTPGWEVVTFALPVGRVGSLLCFEDNFPTLAREAACQGAEILTVLGADTWFAGTMIPAYHAVFSRFRAVENRAYVLRVDNYGPTQVADPWGRIRARLPLGKEGAIRFRLPRYRRPRPTLFMRWGDWLPLGCLLLLVGFSLAARSPLRCSGS